MTKIDKSDIENINFLKKELKLKNIKTVKIQKGNYKIEIVTDGNEDNQKIKKNSYKDAISFEPDQKQEIKINPENIVKSPMVGVAYLSSDPSSPSYIKEGQHVKQGDILLLIEGKINDFC